MKKLLYFTIFLVAISAFLFSKQNNKLTYEVRKDDPVLSKIKKSREDSIKKKINITKIIIEKEKK